MVDHLFTMVSFRLGFGGVCFQSVLEYENLAVIQYLHGQVELVVDYVSRVMEF